MLMPSAEAAVDTAAEVAAAEDTGVWAAADTEVEIEAAIIADLIDTTTGTITGGTITGAMMVTGMAVVTSKSAPSATAMATTTAATGGKTPMATGSTVAKGKALLRGAGLLN